MKSFFNTEEICSYLNISRKTLYNWREKGLPYIKESKSIKYEKEAVENWLMNGRFDNEAKERISKNYKHIFNRVQLTIAKYDTLTKLFKDYELLYEGYKEGNSSTEDITTEEAIENKKLYFGIGHELASMEKACKIDRLKWIYETALINDLYYTTGIDNVINWDAKVRLCQEILSLFPEKDKEGE